MTSKKSHKFKFLRKNWAYFLMFFAIIAVAFFGSRDKSNTAEQSMNMASIAASNYQVSTDQISQFYMVAEVADNLNLASANLASINYTTVAILQQNGQAIDESGKIQKPAIIDISDISRGVVNYTVKDGETMEQIAARYGITADQIRWSNNLKTTSISSGQNLLIPSVPGIVYTVKDGDTVESLASKYGSSADQIITVNDLEKDHTLKVNSVILIPSGVLPETERPEYVVPTTNYNTYTTSYHYAASYTSGNRYAYGWCTWYAWQWRHDNMPSNYDLPGNMGNANTWASAASSAGFKVNRTPAYGAVFQTTAGYLGHVGVVTGVNSDGSIVISDMNGIAGWGRVGTKTIPASQVGQYLYIHGR